MEKNEQFVVTITDMTNEGEGVGKTDGFIWFIKGTVPGDTVLASAMKLKKTYGYARKVKVIEASPDRAEPVCPLAGPCGGCQLQDLSYEAQLRYKENKVLSAVQRIGGFDMAKIHTEPILGMADPLHYRNKAQYPVSLSKDGRVIAGFYAEHTHSVIECAGCAIGAETDRAVLSAVTGFMERYHIAPYEEVTGKGVVRHVLIRTSHATGEIMVCPVINAGKLPHAEEFVSAVTTAVPGVSTICVNINRENTNVILGEQTECLFGSGYITDTIGDVKFQVSPRSFFQVNPVQVEKLYGKALEYAALTGSETVWDLYCGVGTISLFLAQHAKKVLGVEIVPQAVENARENARRNGITNVEFSVGKAEEVTPLWLSCARRVRGTVLSDTPDSPDVICVDPPRKGCDAVCLQTILKASPKRIVYVSCDPASLARDLRVLADGGYELKRLCPVDMFPQTVHVETVALLSRTEK